MNSRTQNPAPPGSGDEAGECQEARSQEVQSQLNEAEQALSERRLRVFFESNMVGAFYWNVDGKILEANNKFLQMTGYSRAEMEDGRLEWTQITPEEYRALDQKALEDFHATGVATPYEKEFVRKDGSRIPIIIGAAMLDGYKCEGVAIVLDNTQRKQAEASLCKAREELLRTNQDLEKIIQQRTATLQETLHELEHFSYTITHDLRAPLRAMQGFGNLLLMEEEKQAPAGDSSKRKDYLRRIVNAAKRMEQLIADALQYNRSIRAEYPLESVDLCPVLRGIVEVYPNLHVGKAQIDLPEQLPIILGNEAALTQCFSNLLGNAVKFVQAGRMPRVRIWGEERGEFERIWVEDNGIGIPKADQERIWQMFQVLENRPDGTGIGLALVRKVVERMGGRAGVESDLGEGSRFWVELRRAHEAA